MSKVHRMREKRRENRTQEKNMERRKK